MAVDVRKLPICGFKKLARFGAGSFYVYKDDRMDLQGAVVGATQRLKDKDEYTNTDDPSGGDLMMIVGGSVTSEVLICAIYMVMYMPNIMGETELKLLEVIAPFPVTDEK